jgi:hypothetical protein
VAPQRCVVNISLDSGLPIVIGKLQQELHIFMVELVAFFAQDYKTVEISIDFVDFLIARIFCGIIEEWFQTLEIAPKSKLTACLIRHSSTIRTVTGQFGRLGGAAFLAGYAWFNGGIGDSVGRLVYAAAIALGLWALVVMLTASITKNTAARLVRNMVPSVILLTDADKRAYDKIREGLNSSRKTLGLITSMAIFNLGLNLAASYIYALLTRP